MEFKGVHVYLKFARLCLSSLCCNGTFGACLQYSIIIVNLYVSMCSDTETDGSRKLYAIYKMKTTNLCSSLISTSVYHIKYDEMKQINRSNPNDHI